MKSIIIGPLYFFIFTSVACTNDSRFFSSEGVKPVDNSFYQEECGVCHFAYQSGLLPERSWEKILSGLEDHFGDNAELDQDDIDILFKYLSKNSADKSNFKRSKKIMRSLRGNATPIRVTKVPYILDKHDEIPKKYITDSSKVNSMSNCDSCHTTADKGIFDDDFVILPN